MAFRLPHLVVSLALATPRIGLCCAVRGMLEGRTRLSRVIVPSDPADGYAVAVDGSHWFSQWFHTFYRFREFPRRWYASQVKRTIALLFAYGVQFCLAQQPTSNNPELTFARSQYAAAVANQQKRPDQNDPDFSSKLSTWADAERTWIACCEKLVALLIREALKMERPGDAFAGLNTELKMLIGPAHAAPLNMQKANLLDHLETQIRPHLYQGLADWHAAALAEYLRPHEGVRIADRAATNGELAEPWGWNLQNSYALILAESRDFPNARKESDLLLLKMQLLLARGKLPFDERQRDTHRRALLTRSLIEALAGDRQTAASFRAKAEALPISGDAPDDELLHRRLVRVLSDAEKN
jgi:hypothetical protein